VFDVLVTNEGFPLYVAVIGFVPTGNLLVVYLATPLLRVTVPSAVVPFLKVTCPLTVPLYCGDTTCAVKVTDCPKLDGFCEEVKLVVVVALLTV
jgi:hypothetical protein